MEQVENFVAAFREGARKVEQDPPKSGGGKPWQLMAVAAVAAGLAAVFVLPRWGGADATPVAISLASYRDQAGMTGPAGKPLRLKLDVEGLEGERFGYRVVSEGRELVAEGSLARGRAEIVVRGLEAGKYWVRVTEGSGGGLLREYGLEIR